MTATPVELSPGRVEAGVHTLPMRIYYEDTDAGGVVYHSNYLKFAERARTEMLRLAGIGQAEMLERDGLGFVVRDLTVDFRRPARLDDVIEVCSTVAEMKAASLTIEQSIMRAGQMLAKLRVRVACIDGDGRPARLPHGVRAAMAELEGDGNSGPRRAG